MTIGAGPFSSIVSSPHRIHRSKVRVKVQGVPTAGLSRRVWKEENAVLGPWEGSSVHCSPRTQEFHRVVLKTHAVDVDVMLGAPLFPQFITQTYGTARLCHVQVFYIPLCPAHSLSCTAVNPSSRPPEKNRPTDGTCEPTFARARAHVIGATSAQRRRRRGAPPPLPRLTSGLWACAPRRGSGPPRCSSPRLPRRSLGRRRVLVSFTPRGCWRRSPRK